MRIPLVVNDAGRVRGPGAAALLLALFVACGAVPALLFWLAFGDAGLTQSALATGLAITAMSFGGILGMNLRLPPEKVATKV